MSIDQQHYPSDISETSSKASDSFSTGATEVFRIPSADATAPDLFRERRLKHPTLTIIKGPQTGAVFQLSSQVITLGRDPNNAVFLNDMTVSREHARIDLAPQETGHCRIEDLGSLNGTWVNGTIVTEGQLEDGSIIQIGTFKMIFHTVAAQRSGTDLFSS